MSQKHLLEIKNISKSYGDKAIVSDLSLSIGRAEIVGLLGHNGAGKTTVFHITMGLITPDEGTLTFLDQEITKTPVHERARMGMGYLAQEPSIFRSLTVEENILCALETQKLKRSERKQRLTKQLEEMNLTHLAKKKVTLLSGGEKRRVEIARTLVTSPSLLLLDEPFANIDPISISEVKKMILELKQKGISIFITDHNAREIFSVVDRSYLMFEGTILISGTVSSLLESPEARLSYLGPNFKL